MPNWKKPLLTIGIAGCLLGGALIATGIATGGISHILHAEQKTYSKQEESYSDISALDIDLSTRDLVISESSDDKAHLTYYKENKGETKITAYDYQGTLSIQQESTSWLFHFSTGLRSIMNLFQNQKEFTTIELQLPKGSSLSQVKVKSSTGDISLSGLTIKDLELDLSTGDIVLEKSSVSKGDISSSLGNVTLNQSSLADSRLHLSTGNLYSEQLTLTGDINIQSSLGNVELDLNRDSLYSLSFDLETNLGNIQVPGDFQAITGEDDFVGAKLKRILDTNTGKVIVKNSSGNIVLSSAN